MTSTEHRSAPAPGEDARPPEGVGGWGFTIRPARRDDVPALHALVLELAVYEREPDAVEGDAADLERALFAEHPLLHALVAEVPTASGGPEVAGMALWFVSYSTWRGRHGIWLEDLFVRPSARRLGIGRALLCELAAEAVRRGYARLEWSVLDWNAPALAFYASLGAQAMHEWTTHRVSDGALAVLAAGASGDSATNRRDVMPSE